MDNVTDISPPQFVCDCDDEYFYITKTVGQRQTMLALTQDEKAHLIEKLMESNQPWKPAG